MSQGNQEPDANQITRREWMRFGVTLGAGGAFAGGLLYWLLRKDGVPPRAVEEAAKAGGEPTGAEAIFSPEQRKALDAAFDTVLPGDPGERFASASQAGVVSFAERLAQKSPSLKSAISGLIGLLDELASTAPAQDGRKPERFVDLSPDARESLLTQLAQNPEARAHVILLVDLCVRGYTLPPTHGGNSLGRGWASLGQTRLIPEAQKGAVAWRPAP